MKRNSLQRIWSQVLQKAPRDQGRRLLAVAALALASLPQARAQQVLVQANVADDTIKTTFGPNRRYFGHAYLGYAVLAGPAGRGAELSSGLASAELRGGGRFKVRFSQLVALNLDLGYAFQHFDLAQTDHKVVPNATQHREEGLSLHQLYSEISLRLNAGRRGNSVGSYLDLLAGGGWVAATAHSTEDEPAPGIGSVETTERGLPYLRRWSGSAGARLGFDRYALVGRYRLTSAFGPAFAAWPELPRWALGLEIGLF
ncbi:hypothetical protein [Hymenobacter properus]|uniref:Outer membrane protein beta-barrel domain-containing protein n=1 Tax=Hymenobacter properus TaxID=2791026 RepID=A0A931BFB5_9BACT|nr:hypothetical protein [Hymenobacter properus]MBF9140636.1 hypothetical protein [Hymenobacter properus]MBR7719444.1 hypothetical protein [Microvirga sp. SRT04]